jgi:hypothetical protein
VNLQQVTTAFSTTENIVRKNVFWATGNEVTKYQRVLLNKEFHTCTVYLLENDTKFTHMKLNEIFIENCTEAVSA